LSARKAPGKAPGNPRLTLGEPSGARIAAKVLTKGGERWEHRRSAKMNLRLTPGEPSGARIAAKVKTNGGELRRWTAHKGNSWMSKAPNLR
jgi:hypothetical protein